MKEDTLGVLHKELEEFVHTFGLEYFPSKDDIYRLTNSCSLCSKIEKNGGYVYWANRLGLPNKRPTKTWSYEKAKEAIQQIIDTTHQNYFPTLNEIKQFTGDCSLSSYITKIGGARKMSMDFNMPLKHSDSLTGWQGEDSVEEQLKSHGYVPEKQTTNCLYDFVVNKVRIDAKYNKIYYGKNGGFYSFNLENKAHDCDIFILVCENDEGDRKYLVVPNIFVFNQSQISVGLNKSKWFAFENKFDFIDKFSDFYKKLEENNGT